MPYMKLQSEYSDLDKYKNSYGDIWYYKKNTKSYHNPYGPAIIYKSGALHYYINNKCHRLDGPAKIFKNSIQEYWINDIQLTKEKFETHSERLKFLGKEHLICLK